MKLVVLGASGGVGQQLVMQAVTRGHAVTAVGRTSSNLSAPDGVTVLRGDLEREEFLCEAFHGRDAVLSSLGLKLPGIAKWHRPERPEFLRASTDAIVTAMKREGISRLVAVSSGGVGDSRDIIPTFFKLFVNVTAMRFVFDELEEMERRFLGSGLDVCIVRPSGLTDEPATGNAHVTRKFTGRASIPRADVAAYMLDQVERGEFSERTPVITVTGG
jgi:putative NADH-flavin reductase